MKIYPKKVYWRDAISDDGAWKTREELIKWADKYYDSLNITYGYLVENNKRYVIMAGSWDGEETFGEYIMIPKSLVVKINNINEAKHNQSNKKG